MKGHFVDIPQAFLEMEGFDRTYWECIGIMAGLLCMWLVLAFIVLNLQIKKVSA